MASKQKAQYDVAVVGLGVLGSAATYFAAHKGAKVVAFEQFEFGHVRGASHDTSRIIRTSYEAPEYVALAKAAYKDWDHIEKAAKQKLVTITGGAVFLPKDKGAPAPDEWTNGIPTAADWAKGLDANQIPYELLNNKQANKRWPALNLADNYEVIYTADTGIVHANKSVAAMQLLARMKGVDMYERTRVKRVIPEDSGINTIETSRGTFTASKVIIAADGWVNQILKPLGLEIPIKVTQEQVTYFKPSDPSAYNPENLPVWVWVGASWYYGFPCYGEPAIKAGADNDEQWTTSDTRTFVPSREKIDALAAHLQSFMPDAGRQELRTVTCLYTRTADREFVISPLKKHKNLIVCLGSAHGFKFAPAIGRVAAELAIDGYTKDDVSRWDAENLIKEVTPSPGEHRYPTKQTFVQQ